MPTILGEDLEMDESEETAEPEQEDAQLHDYTAAERALLEGSHQL